MKILVRVLCIVAFTISLAHARYTDQSSNTLETFRVPGHADLGCLAHPIKTEESVNDLVRGLKSATRFYTCEDSRDQISTRFTVSDCAKAAACRQSVGTSEADLKGADSVLDEVIAKDYLKNALMINGEDMERLATFTKFSQKKYDTKLGSQCLDRFQKKAKSGCNFAFVENTLVEYQKTCSFSVGCFKNDDIDSGVESFSKFVDGHAGSKGQYMHDYYKYRIEKKSSKMVSDDDQKLVKLGELVSSASFKALKLDKKIEKFTKEIGLDVSGRLKDPVLGYDLGTGLVKRFQTSDKFKDIIKLIEAKNVTAKSFATDFDALRKKRAEALLSTDEICGATPTFIKICNEASAIYKGDKIKKEALSAEHLSSRETMTPEYVDRLKMNLGESFNEKDFETLVNARRCVNYGLSDSNGGIPSDIDSLSLSSSSGMNVYESLGRRDTTSSSAADDSRDSMQSIWDRAGGGGSVSGSVKDESVAEKSVRETTSENEAEKVEPFSHSSVVAPVQQAIAANNFTDMYPNSFDAFSSGKEKTSKAEEANEGKGEGAVSAAPSSNDKMTDYLMKKLAAAEENIEKLKADAAAAEEDRAKQKKIDEEAALIKDLKGQISDLKTQTAKNAQKKAADEAAIVQARAQAPEVSRNNSYSNATISSSRLEESAPVQIVDNYENSRAAIAAQQTAISRSIASNNNSGAILTAVNSDGSKTTTLGSGLVVTTVDGMTAEKAAQAISNRILELNGSPFYIEEGGMVKEIIAVIKDGKVLLDEKGKPIFEKIVKGKVGDKKFAIKAKDARAPASITDAADLKRDQEEKLKRERAEYLKLKNLTNEALKKK